MSLVQTLIEAVKARRVKSTASYAATVAAIADGKRVDPAALDELLAASGKTPENLESDVSRVLRRRELCNIIGKRAEIEAAVAAHKAEGERSQKEWEAVYQQRNRECNQWLRERDNLRDELAKCDKAKTELESSFGRVDELVAARGRANVLREQIVATETQIRESPLRAIECRKQGEIRRKGSPEAKDWERRAIDCEDEAKRAEAALPGLRAELEAAQEEERRLYEESQRP